MAPRRSHLKSRNGCFTCKQRRVKCDETGPPCTNCHTRGTECKFPEPKPRSHSPPPTRPIETIQSPASSSGTSTVGSSASSKGKKHISELQLMHRWSTVTFETVSSEIADDREIWRVTVPEVAVKYNFLLNSIFALTSFHMAYANPSEATHYISAALEYQSHAFAKFREDLAEFPDDREAQDKYPDDYFDAMLYCSILLMVLAIASSTQPALKDSMIQNTIIHFELVRGVTLVMLKKPECMKQHRLFTKVPDMMRLPKHTYSLRAAKALQLLNELNEGRAPPVSSDVDEGYGSPGEGQTLPEGRLYLACKNALWWLEYLFATCGELKHRAFALAWLSFSGDDFIRALKDADQVSLLAVMWWGVLLNPLGEEYWFGKDFGADVAREVAEGLNRDNLIAHVLEIIQLAAEEISDGNELNLAVELFGLGGERILSEIGESSDTSNIPDAVMQYTNRQNDRIFNGMDDKRRVRERLLKIKDNTPDEVWKSGLRFDFKRT